MILSKEQFDKIIKKHSTLLVLDSDVEEAFAFVNEVLTAEADALKKAEPYATNTIDRLECAADEVYELERDASNENFSEAG
jgi:hypothetical protein